MMLIKDLNQAGRILSLDETKRIKSGLVVLEPGQEIGAHITDKREEAIIVLEGRASVLVEGEEFLVKDNQLAYIPPEKKHNIINKCEDKLRYLYLVAMS